MPVHIAPFFRSREAALESVGLQVAVNSDGYNVQVAKENVGLATKTPPEQRRGNFAFQGGVITTKE